MSELTNRLRGIYPVGPEGAYGARDFSDFIPPISIEAADRIEELEKELRASPWESLPEGFAIVDMAKLEGDLMRSYAVTGVRFPPTSELADRTRLDGFIKLTNKYIVKSNPE
jgi:hypothetical protein